MSARRSRIDACILACSAGETTGAAIFASATPPWRPKPCVAAFWELSDTVHLRTESYVVKNCAFRSLIFFSTALSCATVESASGTFFRLLMSSAAGFRSARSRDVGDFALDEGEALASGAGVGSLDPP